MSNVPKSLMRHYAEGSIVTRELEQLFNDHAAQHQFDRDMQEDIEVFSARQNVLIHKGNTEEKS